LERKLIEKSTIPWDFPTFYVNKHAKKIIGKPRMVNNDTKLNEALMPIRYPIPNKV
jgi:hypothetical protein